MPVDFTKPAHILAVHGVQTCKDADIDCAEQIRKLVARSLAASHVERQFAVDAWLYEDINDDAIKLCKTLAGAVLKGKPLAGKALHLIVDLVGDVVMAAANGSTAAKIRAGLRGKIIASHEAGHPLVVVAHSLGTVYALDVVSELIGDVRYFAGDDRTTWPVQGLVTMGSPLGLEIDLEDITVFDERPLKNLRGAKHSLFPWHNYFNRLDPIVSGNLFGKPVPIRGASGPVERRYGPVVLPMKWLLQGHVITQGKQWLLAHVEYWKSPLIGDRLVEMLWG